MDKTNEQIAMRVSRNTIIGNALLSVFMLLAGIFANSAAMLSDAVDTFSDVFITGIVIVGVKMAGKESDKEHLYGHERFESVAAIVLAVILCATGAGIGYGGVLRVIAGNRGELAAPGAPALAAALVSVAVKEWMYRYTKAAAQKTGSGALMADAWHHRSDVLSAIGISAGVLGARMGFPVLDSIACLVICVFILRTGLHIFMDSIGKMTDKACDDGLTQEIRALIVSQEHVLAVDLLHTRLFGDRIYVDVEISVDGSLPLYDSHDVAHRVHDAIEAHFPKVKHCMVHVNPMES